MYAIPSVYGDKPFDPRSLPSSMYPMKPYYSIVAGVDPDNQPLPSTLPLPDNVDVNDRDTRLALEDLLSRQLLLMCRLNDLERELIELNPNQIVPAKPTVAGLQTPKEKREDIAIHFNLDDPPMSLFAVLRFLAKDPSMSLLTNFHIHSSLLSNPILAAKKKNFELQLARINFKFNPFEENSERGRRHLTMTFIAKRTDQCQAHFTTKNDPVSGELNVVRTLCSLLTETTPAAAELWNQLTTADFTSTKFCIERLGPYLTGLSQDRYLLDGSSPSLLDLVVWAVATISSVRSHALPSLLDARWCATIKSLVAE